MRIALIDNERCEGMILDWDSLRGITLIVGEATVEVDSRLVISVFGGTLCHRQLPG
jgi:hypothetical protein